MRNNGSHNASAGKYLTGLISRYTLWRLCPSFDLPNRFRASYFPKFPASNTSFSTNLPYFSLEGTIRREAGMPNTSFMIYMIPPANFHNPNSFNSFCTLSIAVEEERAAVTEESVEVEAVAEVISPIASRRSHPAQSGETFDGPPSLERSGSEHRGGAVTSPLPEEEGLGEKVEPSLERGTGWFEKILCKNLS